MLSQPDHATEYSSRSLEWLALADDGVSPVKIGKLYGSAHSLVSRTLEKMRAF